MGPMKITVVLIISLMSILVEYSDCTTHPRVKMYGPQGAVVENREPETITEPNQIDGPDEGVKILSQLEGFLDEPSCYELRALWRTSQRQLTQPPNNNIPIAFHPFDYSTWEDYIKPRYFNRPNSFVYQSFLPDRFYMYRTLIPYEKISRFTTATRSVADEQLPRKAALYQLGSPPIAAKLPIVTPRRLMSKDRFQELKDLIRYNKNRETTADNETISVISTPAVSSNDTGKKRPGYYESMMTRPRHFSDAHYMNKMKPNGDNIDNSLTVTVATSHYKSPLLTGSSWRGVHGSRTV